MNARRQHRDHRASLGRLGGRGRQRASQEHRVVAHLAHFHPAEQLGEHVQHRLAILQHIADARRRAGIVFEDEEIIRPGAHQIGAHDMGIDATRWGYTDHLGQERVVLSDQFGRHPACAQDFLAMIDVVQKRVNRPDTLFDAFGQPRPLAGRDDPRHDIKGDQALIGLRGAIDVKGDAGAAEKPFRLVRLAAQAAQVFFGEPICKACVGRAWAAVWMALFVKKLGRVFHLGIVARNSAGCNQLTAHGSRAER